jgi:hypothetical protein
MYLFAHLVLQNGLTRENVRVFLSMKSSDTEGKNPKTKK